MNIFLTESKSGCIAPCILNLGTRLVRIKIMDIIFRLKWLGREIGEIEINFYQSIFRKCQSMYNLFVSVSTPKQLSIAGTG